MKEQVTLKALNVLREVYDELKDKSSMVTPLQIGSQLVDWTDPQKSLCVGIFPFFCRPLVNPSRKAYQAS